MLVLARPQKVVCELALNYRVALHCALQCIVRLLGGESRRKFVYKHENWHRCKPDHALFIWVGGGGGQNRRSFGVAILKKSKMAAFVISFCYNFITKNHNFIIEGSFLMVFNFKESKTDLCFGGRQSRRSLEGPYWKNLYWHKKNNIWLI